MAHVFVLVEAREVWMQTFLNDLLERRYPYQMSNGNLGYIQINPREIKLFDMTLPKECIPMLMSDLAPFAKKASRTDSPLKDKAGMLAGFVREMGGFKPFNDLTKAVSELEEDEIKDMITKDAPIIGYYYKEILSKYKESFKTYKKFVNETMVKVEKSKFCRIPFLGKKIKSFFRGLFNRIEQQFFDRVGFYLIKFGKSKVIEIPYAGKYLNKLARARMRDDLSVFKPTEEVRHSWVNVMPIGWKEDPVDPDAVKGNFWNLPKTDKGGELL